jgi:hypothetical protein
MCSNLESLVLLFIGSNDPDKDAAVLRCFRQFAEIKVLNQLRGLKVTIYLEDCDFPAGETVWLKTEMERPE